jgi:uncharacterized MAPEG superfamily protein
MTMQETEHQERLGGEGPVRFSARPAATNGSAQPRRSAHRWEFARSAEFLVFAAGVVAVLVAAAIDSGFGAERAWTLVTVLAAAFILSRR